MAILSNDILEAHCYVVTASELILMSTHAVESDRITDRFCMQLMKACAVEKSSNHLLVIDSATYCTYMLIKINLAAETFSE